MKTLGLVFIVFLSGCTFQSNQYELLKNIFNGNKSNDPVLNWTINWTGVDYKFYAINNYNEIYFVNYNDYLIEFDGWQIVKANGFLPNNNAIEVKIESELMNFIENKKIISTAICKPWSKSPINFNKYIRYDQLCEGENFENNFKNSIIISDLNQIIGLKYKINPNYPAILIIMDEYNEIQLSLNR